MGVLWSFEIVFLLSTHWAGDTNHKKVRAPGSTEMKTWLLSSRSPALQEEVSCCGTARSMLS